MQYLNREQMQYAGFFPRAAAYIVDVLLVFLVCAFIRLPMFVVSIGNPDLFVFRPLLFEYSFLDILYAAIQIGYFVIMTCVCGGTLGKRLFQLQVTDECGNRPSFLKILYRETVGRFLTSLCFIGYIVCGVDGEHRGFHDMLADTRVVYKLKNE